MDALKEIFFFVGSLAGVFAFVRPWLESKASRDLERVAHVRGVIDEQQLVDLEHSIYLSRSVYSSHFEPFARLAHERRSGQDSLRFTGPLATDLLAELDALLAAYRNLRKFIQVPWWEPSRIDAASEGTWDFNKKFFFDESGAETNGDYAAHLAAAAQEAANMLAAYHRFQLVAETHLLEIPFARWILPRRFRRHGLSPADSV